MDQLAVVIVNWNRYAETARCVADLLDWRSPPEIWVVDNASSDGSASRLSAGFPSIHTLVASENLGYGGGNNLALSEIDARYALLLNNDAGLEEAAARALCRALDTSPDLAIVGPMVVDAEDREKILSAGGRDISRFVSTNLSVLPRLEVSSDDPDNPRPAEPSEPIAVDYVPGTVAVARMKALFEVGLLDEDYFFGGELADLASRLAARGWGCAVVPSVHAWHDLSHAGESRTVLYRYYILRNRFLFIRRRLRGRERLRLLRWVAYGCYSVPRFLLRGRWRTARAEAWALFDGLLGRFGDQNTKIVG